MVLSTLVYVYLYDCVLLYDVIVCVALCKDLPITITNFLLDYNIGFIVDSSELKHA